MRSGFLISADSTRVVYRVDQDTDGVYELYSVPISGGPAVKLNGTLPTGGDVWEFAVSPDSTRVVYFADQDADGVYELYSVPISGGTAVKLNDTLVTGGGVLDFAVSADSTRVVYRADQDSYNVIELYSVPIAGGTVAKLNDALVTYGNVYNTDYIEDSTVCWWISPDSSRVTYIADQEIDEVRNLYSVPISGAGLNVGVSKTAWPDPEVCAGSNLTYTIIVTNTTALLVEDVVVTDTLPADVEFVSCSRAYTLDGEDVVCELGDLAGGTGVVYTIIAHIPVTTEVGFVENTVTVTHDGSDANASDDTATVWTEVLTARDLGIWKTAAPDPVLAGSELIYTVTVTNAFSREAEWITIIDTLPTNAVVLDASIMWMDMFDWVEFSIEALPAYSSTSFTFSVDVPLDAPSMFTNRIWVSMPGYDLTPSDTAAVHVASVTHPAVMESRQPSDGAAPGADIVVNFSKSIDPVTVDADSFRVHGLFRGAYTGILSVVDNTVTFNPVQDFLPGETITCILSADMESTNGLPIHPHIFQFRAAVPYGKDAPLTDSAQQLGQETSHGVALGDLDGDGDLDAFVANGEDMMMGGGAADKLWLNNGSGVFIDSGLNLGTNVSRCVALGDLDGDGDQDVFIGTGANSDGTPAPNRVLLNNLPNTFTFTPTGAIVSDSVCNAVALGDLDGDGDLDIFEANGPDMMMMTMGENRVLFNDGSGAFTDSGQLLGFAESRSVTLGDLDGDGDLDAVVGNYDEDSVAMINDGRGNFSENMLMDMSGPGGSQSVGVELGDLDGDSDLDLWLVSESGGSIWTNSGSGYLEKGQSLGGSENFVTVALGDLDADGDLDAVTPNYNSEMDTFFAWRNAGGTFSNRTDNPSLSMPYDAALGDLNGDGTLDMFIAGDGANTVWFGQLPAAIDLGISKSANPYTVTNSNALSYTITVSNLSASTASGVVVVDTLPDGVSFVSSVPSADSVVGGVCTYNIAALGAGASTSIVMRVTVAYTTVGAITNSASVSHTAPDPNSANDVAECVVNVNDNDSDGDPDFHDPDDDNDGIDDEWERDNGLDPLGGDAGDNPDKDPYTNEEEYILDFDPGVSNDWFRVQSVTPQLSVYGLL